jgi:hypothetical protein
MEVNEDVGVRPSTAEESGEVIRKTDSGETGREGFFYLPVLDAYPHEGLQDCFLNRRTRVLECQC